MHIQEFHLHSRQEGDGGTKAKGACRYPCVAAWLMPYWPELCHMDTLASEDRGSELLVLAQHIIATSTFLVLLRRYC